MGIPVIPDRRLEPRTLDDATERMSSGNPEADHILGGGFPANSINVVMGHPGSGKTIFAEQLIFHNAGEDRPILYFTTLSEPLSKVVRYLQGFEFYDEEKLGTQVLYEDIGPQLAAQGAGAMIPLLREAITSMSPKVIVIDSFKAVHDLARIRQVPVNLLGNAVKFTPDGGTVLVETATVGVGGVRWGEVRVTDTGPGIPEAERAAIFEPYYRTSETAAAPGVGLGLAISHALVARMGGELLVESEVGVGSAFILRFPAAGAAA